MLDITRTRTIKSRRLFNQCYLNGYGADGRYTASQILHHLNDKCWLTKSIFFCAGLRTDAAFSRPVPGAVIVIESHAVD